MKIRRIVFISILLCLLFVLESFAQSSSSSKPISLINLPDKFSVRCIITYDVAATEETRWVRMTAMVPESIANIQKIRRVEYSMKPTRFFVENGQRYAEFYIQEPKRNEKLEMTIHADLYRYDLETAINERKKNKLQKSDFEEFLKEEKYIETNDRQIKTIAKMINGTTDVQIVRKIYDYVIDNMEYLVQGKNDRGALKALQYKKGDCSEYSDLFVAICRAKKIPARVITGISVQNDTKTAKHNWAEVYLKPYGWVPFDPSKGDVPITSLKEKLFRSLEPTYIYFTDIRNDKVLQNYHYCAFNYFGGVVQVTDSIRFEFPGR